MDNEAMPFLLKFEQNGDWATFGVMADYFAEQDDGVGELWALWIRDNEVMPAAYLLERSLQWTWGTIATKKRVATHQLAFDNLVVEMPYRQYISKSDLDANPRYGLANSYARLLAGWRVISEKDREAIMNGISKG